jgi:hypothetical protein
MNLGEPYWEFWKNDKFCSAGEVFIGREAAEAKLRELRAATPATATAAEQSGSFQDLLPLTPVRIAPGEYEVKTRDGCLLWRMDGAALADWVCASVNGYDAAVNALTPAFTSDKCERCAGTGEVEGYGGNNVYCGHCAGTGKRPNFFPAATTSGAREAAKEIADRWSRHDLPTSAALHSNPTLQLRNLAENVISNHFPSAVPVEEQKCTCCGELECECGPFVARGSKVIDDPCRICGKCINHCPHQ